MDFLDIITQNIKESVEKEIIRANYDKTLKGRITQVLGDGKYMIKINGLEYQCTGLASLAVNDLVYATIIQNDYRNIIATKATSGGSGGSYRVATTNDIDSLFT